MNSRADAALARLRDQGQRITPARRGIVELLATTDEHLGADEIVHRVRAAAADVHRATVFRALTTLTELGVVRHTHLAGSATVYHLAPFERAGDGPHAHLQCSTCGNVIDVDSTVLAGLALRLREELGFELAADHAALLGTCQRCRGGLSPTPSATGPGLRPHSGPGSPTGHH